MDFDLRRFETGDADWLVAEHMAYYARAEGFDQSFGPLVRRIVDDFLHEHDSTREAG